MSLKEIHAPHLGRTVKMGRKLTVARGPRLLLKNYLDMSVLPPAPDCDFTSAARSGLADVLLNDRYGDCTCAGVGHGLDVIVSNAGVPTRITDAQVLALYEAACGFDPNDPSTDQGGDELTVLDYVAEHGIDGKGLHQILGSILVDACDKAEVRWAQWALGNLYMGESMPDEYVDLMPAADGFTWDLEGQPNPENGHCFIGAGSNDKGILIATWGLIGLQTYEALAYYATQPRMGELHAMVTKEWINAASKTTPSGFAFDDLLSDLQKIGANIQS